MAKISKKFDKGVVLKPTTTATTREGELSANSSDNKLKAYLNAQERSVVTEDQAQTLTQKTIDADNNTISNLEVDNLKSGVLDTDLNAVSGADDTIPSAKAVKAYVDQEIDTVDEADEIAYDNTTSGMTATHVQGAIDELDDDVDSLITLSGVARDSDDLGTFTGATIPDTSTVKAALQSLETAHEEVDQNVNDLITLSGVAENATHLGTFTGTTIADSSTVKSALQDLETEVETKSDSSVVSEIDTNVDDLITLSGVAENSTHLGTFTGATIPDSSTVKSALQSLETELETRIDGAGSSTDDALVRWNGTSGASVQDSSVTLSDAGVMSGATQMNVDNLRLDGNVVSSTDTNGNVDITPNGTGVINSNKDHRFYQDVGYEITADNVTGANATLTAPPTKIIRLTNASLSSVDMIPAGSEGQQITLINATGTNITVNNNTGGTAADRILTGTKANLTLKDEASLILEYDNSESRWMVIGGTGSGNSSGINYITNSDAEAGTTGWSTYADAAGTSPVDMTGGSPNVTWASSSSSPLRGVSSFLLTKDAANRQGEGVSYSFTIENADKYQPMKISFDYEVSANYVDGDMRVYVYDVTNSMMLEPDAVEISANANNSKHFCFVQATDSTSYRLGFHVASTSALAYTFKADSVSVGPSTQVNGPIMTDWQDLTGVTVANFSTSSITAKYKRIGGDAHIRIECVFSSAASSFPTVNIPSSLPIDETRNTASPWLGDAQALDASASTMYDGSCYQTATDSQAIRFYGPNTNAWTVGVPFTWASGDNLQLNMIVPIRGWQTNQAISEGSGNRVVVARGVRVTSNQSIASTAATTVILNSAEIDTTGSFNTSTGVWTCPESGYYSVSAFIRIILLTAGDLYNARISRNGTGVIGSTAPVAVTDAAQTYSLSGVLSLVKGDTLELVTDSATDGTYEIVAGSSPNTVTGMSIFKIQTPQSISPGEVVSARGVNSAGLSVANTGTTDLTYNSSKTFDSHGALNTSTGIFTAPSAGFYSIAASVRFASSTYVSGNSGVLLIYKNGVLYSAFRHPVEVSASYILSLSIYDKVSLVKGDTIKIVIFNDRTAGATTLLADATVNWFTICKEQ